MIYPKEFENLMYDFQRFPGIGEKSSERFVYAVEQLDLSDVEKFAKDLLEFKNNITKCKICGHYSTNDELCNVCSNESRDKSTICVVEDSKSVFMFEKTGSYKGLYHVLGGLISPIDDINPDDLNIDFLVKNRLNGEVKEVIIAINPSIQGETTSLYLQKLLQKKNIKVSRLSYGLPMGSDIEYMNPLTIMKAIEDRKDIS